MCLRLWGVLRADDAVACGSSHGVMRPVLLLSAAGLYAPQGHGSYAGLPGLHRLAVTGTSVWRTSASLPVTWRTI